VVEAYEDWPDHCCQERCRKTSGQVRRPKMVAEEAGKRARKEECFRPSLPCVGESDRVRDQKGSVAESAKAEIALND
jgi:hypothetical protein